MSSKLKLAIIGTGSRGVGCFGKILAARSDVQITALCDTNKVRAAAAREILHIPANIYTSIEDMAVTETLDGVIITTPDRDHYSCARRAMLAGWNVLIDKPLATNARDGRELIELSQKIGKVLMIGFNLRHSEVLRQLKRFIDDGTLGKVFIAENREFYDGGRTYMSRWNRSYAATGGLWIHKASHDFDIFNWLLGFPEPLRVSSFAAVNILNKDNLPFEPEAGKTPGPDCTHCPYIDKCPDKYLPEAEELKLWSDEAVAEDGYVKNLCMYLSEKDTHDNGLAIVEYAGNIKVGLFESFIGSKNDRIYTVTGDRATAEVSLESCTIKITPRWGGEVVTHKIVIPEGSHGGADPGLVEQFCKVIRGEAVNAGRSCGNFAPRTPDGGNKRTDVRLCGNGFSI